MNYRYIIAVTCCVLLIVICLVACAPTQSAVPQTPSVPAVTTPQTPAAQDLPKPAAVQQNRKILFQDDCKDHKSGWRVFANDFGEGKYENGSYTLKCIRVSYPKFEVYTSNPGLMPLTSFALDMDVTMLNGDRDDQIGILLKWPDINPNGIEGYEQPSDYYFLIGPADMSALAYSKQEVKGSSVDKTPGYFLERKQYTCVKGVNSVNNIKISFNPEIRFLVNDYELFKTMDENLDYVNRLIKDNTIAGATLQVIANSGKAFASPVFQLNKIAVYANN